jgi:hypothetical protein
MNASVYLIGGITNAGSATANATGGRAIPNVVR